MSKIFDISGNFVTHITKDWKMPDIAFNGEIVVEPNGHFIGYCNELYDDLEEEENKVRYLTGYIANNNRDGKEGICFYKLSNFKLQEPIQYIMYDFEDEKSGAWAILLTMPHIFTKPIIFFTLADRAKVSIAEKSVEDLDGEADRISRRFNELNTSIGWNNEMVNSVEKCYEILTTLKTD